MRFSGDPPAAVRIEPSSLKRLAWFVVIYGVSVATFALVAWAIRMALQ